MKIKLPLFVVLPRKTKADRKMIINLNNYRNWHYITSNDTKTKYKEALESQLKGLKFESPICLEFILYKGSNRKSDRSNVLSIQEKFFCDALVDFGCIEDDNDDIILKTTYTSGGLCKEDPRVDVYIVDNMPSDREKSELAELEVKLKDCVEMYKPMFGGQDSIEVIGVLGKLKRTKTVADRIMLIKQVLKLCNYE